MADAPAPPATPTTAPPRRGGGRGRRGGGVSGGESRRPVHEADGVGKDSDAPTGAADAVIKDGDTAGKQSDAVSAGAAPAGKDTRRGQTARRGARGAAAAAHGSRPATGSTAAPAATDSEAPGSVPAAASAPSAPRAVRPMYRPPPVALLCEVKLSAWVPAEQTNACLAAAKGWRGDLNVFLEVPPAPPSDGATPPSAWREIVLHGEAKQVFEAYRVVSSCVEDVDDVVLTFAVLQERLHLLVGPDQAVLRRISAQTGARIFVPQPTKAGGATASDSAAAPADASGSNIVCVEGDAATARLAFGAMMDVLTPAGHRLVSANAEIGGELIGAVIGAQGQHIKLLTERAACKIDMRSHFDTPAPVPAPAPKGETSNSGDVDEAATAATTDDGPSKGRKTESTPPLRKADRATLLIQGPADGVALVQAVVAKLKTPGVLFRRAFDAALAEHCNVHGYLLPADPAFTALFGSSLHPYRMDLPPLPTPPAPPAPAVTSASAEARRDAAAPASGGAHARAGDHAASDAARPWTASHDSKAAVTGSTAATSSSVHVGANSRPANSAPLSGSHAHSQADPAARAHTTAPAHVVSSSTQRPGAATAVSVSAAPASKGSDANSGRSADAEAAAGVRPGRPRGGSARRPDGSHSAANRGRAAAPPGGASEAAVNGPTPDAGPAVRGGRPRGRGGRGGVVASAPPSADAPSPGTHAHTYTHTHTHGADGAASPGRGRGHGRGHGQGRGGARGSAPGGAPAADASPAAQP